MTERPLVSVVVPARDAARGVTRLLAALADQSLARPLAEVIVVDDGSRDGTAEVVTRSGFAVCVRQPSPTGSYGARNRGLAVARAATVAFTDADCVPRRDWLESGLRALSELDAQLIGGRIETPLGDAPTLAEMVDVARGLDQRRCVEEWGFAATANLFVRREVFDRIGPFNQRLRSGGDDELSRRAVAAGFSLRHARAAVVVHDARRTPRAVARKAFRVGHGGGMLRRVGQGPAQQRPRLWARPRAWVPRRGLLGEERLVEQGLVLSRRQRGMLDVAQWALVQAPSLAGELAADLGWPARRT